MSLESLDRLLGSLQKQAKWQDQQQFQHLLAAWTHIVGPVVAQQTRPLTITHQGVLKVATSSSVWAQNLAFERHLILKKLNAQLTKPLTDLYFSTSQWQGEVRPSPNWLAQPRHQGTLTNNLPAEKVVATKDPQLAFQQWAKKVKARSQKLPLCPQCQCPTPASELEQWPVCTLCAVRSR